MTRLATRTSSTTGMRSIAPANPSRIDVCVFDSSVLSIVGVLVLAQVESALPAIENNQLDNTSSAILSGFNGAMELFPVVLLVLVASLVIGIVQRLRR